MALNRISILGLGLLGGSVGLATARKISDCTVVGYSIDGADVETALRCGAIHVSASQPGAAAANADLIVLCTPVSAYPAILQAIAPHLEPDAIVTDVGSTKENVIAAARRYLPNPAQFVASHPMAGSERNGITSARADLFESVACIVTPIDENPQHAVAQVEEFWRKLGARTLRLSPSVHDEYVARVSHLPHALAAAMVNVTPDAALDVRGKGYLDFTRIAAGDGSLWQEILDDNRANVLAALDELTDDLTRFRTMLKQGDREGLKQWLNAAAERRRHLSIPHTSAGEYRPQPPAPEEA